MASDNFSDLRSSATNSWQWVASFLTIGALLLGGIVTFFIQTGTLAGVVSAQAITLSNVEVTITRLNDMLVTQRTQIATLQADLIHIETQFCSEDVVRNLTHSSDLRIDAMLWAKTFPASIYPTDNAYYPIICDATIKEQRPQN